MTTLRIYRRLGGEDYHSTKIHIWLSFSNIVLNMAYASGHMPARYLSRTACIGTTLAGVVFAINRFIQITSLLRIPIKRSVDGMSNPCKTAD